MAIRKSEPSTKLSNMLNSFLFNNVLVKHVPWHGQDVHPVTGIAFYVNNGEGGVIGVRVYPDGRKEVVNATNKEARPQRKEIYLQFKHPWCPGKHILASRAVHIAWIGPIPEGMTIDHINGISTDNRSCNLRCVSGAINSRDGAFLRKLKAAGFEPPRIERAYLLRYFDRMAKFKAEHTYAEYKNLTKNDLTHLLYDNEYCQHIRFTHCPK